MTSVTTTITVVVMVAIIIIIIVVMKVTAKITRMKAMIVELFRYRPQQTGRFQHQKSNNCVKSTKHLYPKICSP